MKQKSQNRFLAALLAVAMMLQMLPMLAFAEDAPGTEVAWNINKHNKGYPSLEAAVIDADSGDTIKLGAGNYTLHNKLKDNQKPKGKDLTFVGQGPEVTTWQIGPEVPDPKLFGSEYNGDYSFDGAGKITFKNMKLCTGDARIIWASSVRIRLWWITAKSTAGPPTGVIPVQCSLIRPSMLHPSIMRSGRIAPRP